MRSTARVQLTLVLVFAAIGVWLLAAPAPAAAASCTGVTVSTLPDGTRAPDGSLLSSPISAWEQVSAQCDEEADTITVKVPDCQPGCGGATHRSILEWWAHAPADCTVSQTTNPNDTLTCPGKADGRICIYIKKDPGPTAATAIANEPIEVVFEDATLDFSPPLGGDSPGCGPADHPQNGTPPTIDGIPSPGKLLTCGPGTWSPADGLTPTFQWFKNGEPISGANTDTYIVAPGDDGAEITCEVTMTNAEGDQGSATSAGVEIVTGGSTIPISQRCPGTEPPLPRPCANIAVQKYVFRADGLHGVVGNDTIAVGETVDFQIQIYEYGPDDPGQITITETLPAGFVVDQMFNLACTGGTGSGAQRLQCTEGGAGNVGHVIGHFTHAGPFTNTVVAKGSVVDPFPGDNQASRTVTVTDPRATGKATTGPGGSVTAKGSAGTAKGSVAGAPAAPSIAKVQVALLRKGKHRAGARLSKSGGCAWLASKRGKVRNLKADAKGKCSTAVWLTVKGTAHWRFHASHLKRGGYTLYIRAVDSGGASESMFSRARKNALKLTIR